MKKIDTPLAPKALGPYSQAVMANGLVFCSGQLGIDPVTNSLRDGIQDQTRQVLKNLKAVIEESGSHLDKVVRCDIFLTNLKDFDALNQIYSEFFINDPKPARQTVEVSNLPKGALVEISCVAVID